MRGIEHADGGHGAATLRQAEAVKEAATALRRQGRTGPLHFKIDGTGRAVEMSRSQTARAEVRGLLVELAKAKEPWRIEALHRKIKLASVEL